MSLVVFPAAQEEAAVFIGRGIRTPGHRPLQKLRKKEGLLTENHYIYMFLPIMAHIGHTVPFEALPLILIGGGQ